MAICKPQTAHNQETFLIIKRKYSNSVKTSQR